MHCPICNANSRYFLQVDRRDYWRCEHCEATFLDPQQRPRAVDEQAEYRLHRNDVDDPGYRQFLSRLATPLLARLEGRQQGLDYGCGPGPALAAMMTEAGHDMTLYDPLFFPDPAALERSYDFICCSEVVEHFHHPAAEFARLDRLLRSGGYLAVMTQFQTEDAAFAGWHYRRDPTHVLFYRQRSFQVIARQLGWQCEFPCRNVALLHKTPPAP